MPHEPISQAASCMANVSRRVKRQRATIDDIGRSAGKEVVDMIGTMTGACKNGGVAEVGASATTWVGAGE